MGSLTTVPPVFIPKKNSTSAPQEEVDGEGINKSNVMVLFAKLEIPKEAAFNRLGFVKLMSQEPGPLTVLAMLEL